MNAVRRRLSAAGTVLVILSGIFMVPERTADEARVFARADELAAPVAPASPGSAPASPGAVPAAAASPRPVAAADTAAMASGAAETPKRGDLSHLTYTATQGLHAVLVAPMVQDTVTTELSRVAVSTGEGGGVELAVNGKIVPLTQLGARAVDKKSGESLYTFYGVRFAPGPNDVALTPLGAGGLRGATTRTTVYGSGKPVALRAAIAGELRADGSTPVLLTVHALDAWHHSAAAGSAVRVTVRRGDVKLLPAPVPSTAPNAADAADGAPPPTPSPATSSSPVPVNALDLAVGKDGDARVLVVPGTVSGDAAVGFSSGDASGDESLFVRPFLRKALVVGLLSAGAGAAPGSRDGDDHVDDGGSKRGRAAFFATGEALRGVASTIAYDTASRLAPSSALGPFVDNPDQRPYQTYGDTSTRRDDVLSKDRLYARFESGRDAFTYGRFDADTGPLRDAGASAYHEVLSGAKLDLADRGGRVRATAFSARNDVAYARRIIDVTGLSTFGQLLHPDIVVGSDIVTLDALDTRTGAIAAERPLERNVDYVLDTLSGTLRFIEVPLPYDEFFRRQVVVVRYQYAAGDGGARTTGGRVGASFGRGGLGDASVGYVNDAGGAGNFALLQENLRLRTALGQLDFAHVTSAGTIPGADGGASGQSWHAGYGAQRGGTRLSASYDKTSAGFDDPFGGLAAAGLTDQRVALSRALPRKGELTLSYDAQRNDLDGRGDSQSDASLTLRQPLSRRLTVEGGLDFRRATSSGGALPLGALVPLDPLATPVPQSSDAPSSTTTTQARVAAQYTVGTRSAIRAERITDIGGSASASQPGETALTIDQRLGDGTRMFARELWNDAPQRSFAAATSELATSGATHRTTVGFERKLGAATTVSSEYTVDHTANGSDLYSSIGVREVLKLSRRLRGNAFVQTAAGSGASSADAGSGFTAYGLDLAYASERFHATSSFQDRAGALGGTTLALGAAGALSPDMSLVGNLNSARNEGFRDTQARVGLAWRPHDGDNGAALLELERHDGTLATSGTRTDTLSFEAAWRPTGRFEVDSRVAYKLDGDGAYAAHTTLLGMREVQRIGSRFDVGYEMRLLSVPGIGAARSTEFAAESGLRLGDSLRFALGYNFTGATDPALVGQKTRRGVYATFTSVVSRVFGWGK